MKNQKLMFAITIILLVIAFCFLCVALAQTAQAVEPSDILWTDRMIWAHEVADQARALGYSDDSEIIQTLSRLWWQEWEDESIIAKTVSYEANPEYCEWEHSMAVAVVILNRVKSPYFADTVKDVVASPGQYVEWYTYGFDKVPRLCYEVARDAMNGRHDIPDDVLWQAEFPQGKEIWKIFRVDTGYYASTTYICRGVA